MATWKDSTHSAWQSSSGPGRTSGRRSRGSGRRLSKAEMRRVYLRRRIIAVIVLAAVIAAAVWGGVAIARTLSRRHSAASTVQEAKPRASSSAASEGQSVHRTEKSRLSGIPDCTASDLELSLSAQQSTVESGGTAIFSVSVAHKGQRDCLIDAANGSRVLAVASGNTVVWRSDICESSARMLLMTDKDVDTQKISWGTKAAQSSCKPDSALENVQPGTYTAYTYIKDDPSIRSAKVPVIVTQPAAPAPSSEPGMSDSSAQDNGTGQGNSDNRQ